MNKNERNVDSDILRIYRDGDKETALKLFVSEYQAKIYSLTYRMLGNHDDAVDALQEILIQVNRSLNSFAGKSSLYTWVYRLSTNVCLNFRKKNSHKHVEWNEDSLYTAMLPMERPNEDPDKMCETKYKQFLVQQAILQLPETQRAVVVLHDLEGVPIPNIAGILDINITAAKSRLHRGRAALHRIISKGFEVKGMEGVGLFSIGASGHLI
jgi:RNA polymerase sigma factor, sigma-70 family